jgi:hypothetical protein
MTEYSSVADVKGNDPRDPTLERGGYWHVRPAAGILQHVEQDGPLVVSQHVVLLQK